MLVDGGRMRVATPDLDYLVDVFSTDWRRNMPEWNKYGYEWIANRAEQLNLVMREWGHRWLYNEEEMIRLAKMAGLTALERCELGESSEPRFRGVDYRDGSTLIYEFVKTRPAVRTDDPLVSILITAYNPRYFAEALESALKQSYRNVEILIGDDRESGEIERIVSGYADDRIQYTRNEHNIGEKKNLIECFARSRGEYVKFLNDDDALDPQCVERMVRCLNEYPDVTLVTSHRQVIDGAGRELADIAATRRPVTEDSYIGGVSLARALLESGLNFVGEPSTTMFRRSDLAHAQPNILSFAGRECIGTVDVTMWTHLLSQGDAIYLVDTLSQFRLHPEQAQRSTDYVKRQAGPAREQILFDAKRMGLLNRTGPLKLSVRPLAGSPSASLNENDAMRPRTHDGAPLVSIVIPVFNRIEFTQKCLDAIAKNTPARMYEIVIVDNGSTDGTGEALKGLPDHVVRVVSNKENVGFSKACNQGAQAAAGTYVLFLNNDTEPKPGWLEPLIEVLDADASVAGVGSKLLYPDGTIQHAGVIVVEDKTAAAHLVARHIYYRNPGDTSGAGQMRTYQALTAACVLIRASAFRDVGGFDEGYWNGYEDVDLCFKLQMEDWKLVYQPQSVVIHHESQSGPERFSKVDENVARLQERWRGRINPDVIREADGTTRRTDVEIAGPYELTRRDGPAGAQSAAIPVRPAQEVVHDPAANDAAVTMARERLADVVSIVILTRNQLRYTRECVESIQRHTPEAHEIVFVDNGSSDGTVRWIERQIEDHAHYRLIKNEKNLGFAKGCNQGINDSRGEFILLLNNDVVVTPGWLSGMLECLRSEVNAGFVGPMTNNISGPQMVPAVSYKSTTAGLDEFASAFGERNRARRIPLRRIVGFCMLFRSAVAAKIGLLDERFGSGNYEDDDFCLRATLLGMENVVAGQVFVHHYGGRTFAGNRMNFGHAMTGNRMLFAKKWSSIGPDTALGARLQAIQASEKAADLHASGQTEQAIEMVVRGLEHAPTDRVLHDTMVRILLDAEHFKEALDVLQDAPGDSDDATNIVRIGYCQEALGLTDEADASADRVLAQDPRSALALNLKGVVARKRDDVAAGAEWHRQAMEADPALGEPVTQLGALEWAAGRREAGLDLLERGFVLAPGSAASAAAYHSAVTAEEAWERASRVLAEARALRPMDKPVAFFLIETLIRQDKHAAAMEAIEHAMLNFGIDDGILDAALGVRSNIGPLEQSTTASKHGSLSLCMIVKNEAHNLARCLASVRSVVTEIIVVDTGSTDRTPDIATAFGAKVFEHPWTGDFSEARNVSLSRASGDEILVLDADEVIAAQDLDALARLARKGSRKARAWSFVTRNYMVPVNNANWTANDGSYPQEEAGTGWFPSPKVRLFPNGRNIRFSAPVHEVVEPSLAKLGIPVKEAPIPVHHYGKLNARDDRKKGEAYYDLGKKKIDELGDDVIAISELAIQARALEKYDEAVALWQRVLAIRPDLAIAWFNMGSALIELQQYDEALSASRKAMELDGEQKEIACNCAIGELYAGDVRKSIVALQTVLQKWPDYPVAKVLLAAALCCAGTAVEAEESLATLREQGFELADYLAVITENLITAGREDFAQRILDAAREGEIVVPGAPLDNRA